MNRNLIVLGAVPIVAGPLWPWLKKMHLFHLPCDIVIDRPGFSRGVAFGVWNIGPRYLRKSGAYRAYLDEIFHNPSALISCCPMA